MKFVKPLFAINVFAIFNTTIYTFNKYILENTGFDVLKLINVDVDTNILLESLTMILYPLSFIYLIILCIYKIIYFGRKTTKEINIGVKYYKKIKNSKK